MPPTTIRPLTASADAEAVAALFGRAADYVQLETGAPPDAATAAAFFTDAPPGQDPAAGLRLGLFSGDRLDGIAEMAFDYPAPGDAYLGLLLLAPEARGRGLGRRVLDRAIEEARARGAPALYLAVLDGNAAGRRYWERAGFSVVTSFPPVQLGAKWHIRHRMRRPLGEPG